MTKNSKQQLFHPLSALKALSCSKPARAGQPDAICGKGLAQTLLNRSLTALTFHTLNEHYVGEEIIFGSETNEFGIIDAAGDPLSHLRLWICQPGLLRTGDVRWTESCCRIAMSRQIKRRKGRVSKSAICNS